MGRSKHEAAPGGPPPLAGTIRSRLERLLLIGPGESQRENPGGRYSDSSDQENEILPLRERFPGDVGLSFFS